MKKGTATVIKNTGKDYLLSELPEWNPFPAVIRGRMRLKGLHTTNPVAVGDIVEYEAEEDSAAVAAIIRVLPRKNYIIRKSVNLSRE
ncbi:MAG: ribosome small subunit-dependent GTPase A, partial [Alistipes sp.]|nr:ribosome small subunit-dependent GTPase A [Candidatus Minthomonas equi]